MNLRQGGIDVYKRQGKSDIDQAIAAGADVYVTGDIGHHEGIDALARGLNIIDEMCIRDRQCTVQN